MLVLVGSDSGGNCPGLLSDWEPGQAQTNPRPGLTGPLNRVQLYTTEQSGAVSRLYQKLTGGFCILSCMDHDGPN